jgi:hypothetical protein
VVDRIKHAPHKSPISKEKKTTPRNGGNKPITPELDKLHVIYDEYQSDDLDSASYVDTDE